MVVKIPRNKLEKRDCGDEEQEERAQKRRRRDGWKSNRDSNRGTPKGEDFCMSNSDDDDEQDEAAASRDDATPYDLLL